VQVYADGFERLSVKDKILCWHLYQAALARPDIYMTQRSAEGLDIRDLCEENPDALEGCRRGDARPRASLHETLWVNNSPTTISRLTRI